MSMVIPTSAPPFEGEPPMAKLPAALTNTILAEIDRWWMRAGALTTSEAGRAYIEADIIRKLQAATLPFDFAIQMAEAGHEPAQLALRKFIDAAMEVDRFNDLPLSVRNYARRLIVRPEQPGYGPGHNIINTWTRDSVIIFLVTRTMETWQLKKKPAAVFVGTVLKRHGVMDGRQVLRIYNARHTLGQRVIEFLMAQIPND
jgi:hypothetical protein